MPAIHLAVRTKSHRRLRVADVRWELFSFPEVRDVVELEAGVIGVYCNPEPDVRTWRAALEPLGYDIELRADESFGADSAAAA